MLAINSAGQTNDATFREIIENPVTFPGPFVIVVRLII